MTKKMVSRSRKEKPNSFQKIPLDHRLISDPEKSLKEKELKLKLFFSFQEDFKIAPIRSAKAQTSYGDSGMKKTFFRK
jgi:hypothetical protein